MTNTAEINTLIFGSEAMKYWFNDAKNPKDIDIIVNSKDTPKNINEKGLSVEFYYSPGFKYIFKNNKDKQYVDPDFLYTIKVSHAAWDVNWTKTMKDIEFLKSKGCKLDMELFKLLYRDWENLHGKKNVKMNVENDNFFKENIKRKFDHDWLHEQIAFNDRPMNEKIRKDLNSPYCSEELWDRLNHDEKIKTALEELFVLTAERYIFVDKPLPLQFARTKMLKQMITSTTSGWFNRFLIENFSELREAEHEYFKMKIQKIKDIENG